VKCTSVGFPGRETCVPESKFGIISSLHWILLKWVWVCCSLGNLAVTLAIARGAFLITSYLKYNVYTEFRPNNQTKTPESFGPLKHFFEDWSCCWVRYYLVTSFSCSSGFGQFSVQLTLEKKFTPCTTSTQVIVLQQHKKSPHLATFVPFLLWSEKFGGFLNCIFNYSSTDKNPWNTQISFHFSLWIYLRMQFTEYNWEKISKLNPAGLCSQIGSDSPSASEEGISNTCPKVLRLPRTVCSLEFWGVFQYHWEVLCLVMMPHCTLPQITFFFSRGSPTFLYNSPPQFCPLLAQQASRPMPSDLVVRLVR